MLRVTGIPDRKAKMSLLACGGKKQMMVNFFHPNSSRCVPHPKDGIESDTWSRIEDLFDLCLWRRSTRPAMISLGTMSRSLKNSAKRLATSEYASWGGQQQIDQRSTLRTLTLIQSICMGPCFFYRIAPQSVHLAK